MIRLRKTAIRILLLLVAFCAAPIALAWGILAAIADPDGRRAVSITLAFDTLANAAIGGDRMQTISAATGIEAAKGKRWARVLCRLLGWMDRNHCANAVAWWDAHKPEGGA